MALSNIFREPRRELIEQAFGIVPVAFLIGADLLVGRGIYWLLFNSGRTADLIGSTVLIAPFAILVAVALFFFAHSLGEGICDAMARAGRDPRPKNRR